MNQEARSSRVGSTLASILGVLGFVLSVVSLGWQVHVHEESLTDKALIRFSISFLNHDKEIRSVTKTAKNRSDVELDPSSLNKNELSAEVVNIGQHPLYVKQVRLIVPCPESGDSDSINCDRSPDWRACAKKGHFDCIDFHWKGFTGPTKRRPNSEIIAGCG